MTDKDPDNAFAARTRRLRLRIEIAPMSFIIAVLVALATWTLVKLLPALLVLLGALIIVGTLNPAVCWLVARSICRRASIALVFSLLLMLVLATATLTVPALIAQFSSLIQQESTLRAHVVKFSASYPLTGVLAAAVRDLQYDALIKSAGTQLLTCVLMGLFMFILLIACGVPNALALAFFGGVADVLPFVGIFLTMVPAVLASLSQGLVVTMIVLVVMLCYEEFESRVLVPLVYGLELRLPSSLVLFALIAGGTLAGVLGALLALPVAATILMLIDEARMAMPGEDVQRAEMGTKQQDERSEEEYRRRTYGMPAEQAAAVALEISQARKKPEGGLPDKHTQWTQNTAKLGRSSKLNFKRITLGMSVTSGQL